MSNLRLVVVGRFCRNEEVVVVEPLFADTWFDGAANSVDAVPVPPKRVYVNYGAELQELIDGRDDEQFWREGC
jgi:hypothetical protein